MTKTGKIEAGKIHSGENAKGSWRNISLLVDGEWASTFEASIIDAWEQGTLRKGDEIEYEREQNEKGFWNFTKIKSPGVKTADKLLEKEELAVVKQPLEVEKEKHGDVQGDIDLLWSIYSRFSEKNRESASKLGETPEEVLSKMAISVYIQLKRAGCC